MAQKYEQRKHWKPAVILLVVFMAALAFLSWRVPNRRDSTTDPADAAFSEELIAQIEAEDGTITAPFQKKDGYIYQTTHNSDSVSGGGVAKYQFTAPETGVYTVRGKIKTVTDGNNSFYVDVDKMPSAPEDIWDTPIYSDFTWKRVSARGNGTFDNNEFQPKYYNLNAGTHTVYIVGREPNTLLDRIQIHLQISDQPSTPGPSMSPAPTVPASANIIPNGDFESGDFSNFRSLQECCSYSTTIVKSPVRHGTYAVRFELNQTDPLVESSKRVEITSPDTEFNKYYWYRFSVYLPDDWQVDSSREIIDQWHNHPDAGEDYRNPVLSLRVDGKNWGLRSLWDAQKITEINKYDGDLYVDLGPYQKGVWTDWAVHVRWSYSGTNGFLEVFKNGKSVYKRIGPNTFNDPTGPYFKFGIYKWDWRTGTTDVKKRVLYQDNVSMVKE